MVLILATEENPRTPWRNRVARKQGTRNVTDIFHPNHQHHHETCSLMKECLRLSYWLKKSSGCFGSFNCAFRESSRTCNHVLYHIALPARYTFHDNSIPYQKSESRSFHSHQEQQLAVLPIGQKHSLTAARHTPSQPDHFIHPPAHPIHPIYLTASYPQHKQN